MAKKKNEVIDEIIEEEVVEAVEEVIEEPVQEVIEEPVAEPVTNGTENQFLYTQLEMINKLNNPAKAKRLADRVLRNRKR